MRTFELVVPASQIALLAGLAVCAVRLFRVNRARRKPLWIVCAVLAALLVAPLAHPQSRRAALFLPGIAGFLAMQVVDRIVDPRECHAGHLTPKLMALAEEQGDRIRAALEDHRAREGRYPRRLRELGLPEAQTSLPCGTEWEYELEPDFGAPYWLHLGDYGRNGFVLFRDPKADDWYWDT